MTPEGAVFRNAWVSVHEDEVETPEGTRRMTRIVERDGRPGVAIICRTDDRLLLVRQHRHAVDRHLWELPRGFGETDDPVADARRELLEETRVAVDDLVPLGAIHPNSGILSVRVEVFRCEVPADVAAAARAGDEVDAVGWFGDAEVDALIADGDLRDGISLGALHLERAVQGDRDP